MSECGDSDTGKGSAARAVRAAWIGKVMAQARIQELQCPLLWTTAASYEGVLEEKLRDLVTLAPSTWDAVVRDIVRVTRCAQPASPHNMGPCLSTHIHIRAHYSPKFTI